MGTNGASYVVEPNQGIKRVCFINDAVRNVVDLEPPTLYETEFKGRSYWFGYSFKPATSSKEREQFIRTIKELDGISPSEAQPRKLIGDPLTLLNKRVNLAQFDFLVYPTSCRSPLVKKIISQIDEWTSHDIRGVSLELVKRPPQEIAFDWGKFDRRYAPTTPSEQNANSQMKEYIETRLLPAIHASKYFALSTYVKARYRPYIMNFLEFNENQLAEYEALRATQNARVLVVDDINTTGSTLNEIIRMLGKTNPYLDIYIFTLLGRPEL